MFFNASASQPAKLPRHTGRYIIPAVAVCLLMLLSACNGDDPVSEDPPPEVEPPAVVSPIDDQEMKADEEPLTFDLEAVFDDPSDVGLDYDASSTDTGVSTAEVDEATLTMTPESGGEAVIEVTATNEAGSAETDFELVVLLPDPPDQPED